MTTPSARRKRPRGGVDRLPSGAFRVRVYAGQDPETGIPVIHAYLNPLVKWVWLGGVIVVFGTLLALMPNRRVALSLAAVPESAPSVVAQGLQPSITLREGHD